jgi:hypothetical protein
MTDHAKSNAAAWLETINAAIGGYYALANGETESTMLDGETFDDADDVRQRIEEMPLSVQVRGPWHTPGDDQGLDDAEYEILLSTGGPALRIRGELDRGSPTSARLQFQDWGTPWTYYPLSNGDAENLIAFASMFYFGA